VILVYRLDSGFIELATVGGMTLAFCKEHNTPEGCDAIEVDDDMGFDRDRNYILNGQPTERPASPVTRTDLTLHDVPNGATLWINGVSYPAEGEVELEFPLPGTFNLRVECFPFLDWTDEVAIP